MKLYLAEKFNGANFTGEIVSSSIIMFFILLISSTYSHDKVKRNILIGLGLISAIFAGQGISNSMMRGTPVYGILPSAIMSSFFYDEFNLLWSIMGAQIIGTIIGYAFYIPIKILFPNVNRVDEVEKDLTYIQVGVKEIVAQLLLMIFVLYISHATFNSGLTSIDISPLITNLISLVALITLMFIFDNFNGFMISPFISIVLLIHSRKIIVKNELICLAIQSASFTTMALTIGFIYKATNWWQ